MMASNPSTEMTRNHNSMIGPKARPIFSVPNRWDANKPNRMATAIGITKGLNDAVTAFNPSSALKTDIAGVMTPSP